MQEEETPTDDIIVPKTIATDSGTISGSSSTTTIVYQRLHKLLYDEIATNER